MSKLYYHVLIEYNKSIFHIFTSDDKEWAEMYLEDAEYIVGFIPDHTELPTAIVRRYKLINIYKKESEICLWSKHFNHIAPNPMDTPATIYILGTKTEELNIEDVKTKKVPYIEHLYFENTNMFLDEQISEFYCN